ncbi:HIRAN domain-containing protein [Pseudonocardia acaciae]|uniref:HIRAN domain-containing protein n=1 Tax=Pseudonocardia acaciae TaxID=551276 RepID=UPI000B1A0F1C|nr:HIRAN domain-containing protein [Pseudonocardia acaciae]
MTQTESNRTGPTIILIGGQMTTDDGARLDSRQPLDGDRRSEVMLRSLSTSLLWWRTASSLATPLLDGAGPDAFALLVSTQRTIVELRHDGTTQRTRLNAMLPGGTTTTQLIRVLGNERLPEHYQEAHILRDWSDNHYIGTIGVKPGAAGKRWRFLRGGEYYLAYAVKKINPVMIIDTTVAIFDGITDSDRGMTYSQREHGALGHRFRVLEETRLFSNDSVLILPHTYMTESFLDHYSEWVAAGRPSTASQDEDYSWLRSARALAHSEDYNPDETPDPMERTLPVPTEADFRVTGLMENAQWHDSAHLEASRVLLQARYDLKIGIWDLARNPTLRQTLLDPTPIAAPPTATAPIPDAARRRAEASIGTELGRRAAEKNTWTAILASLAPMIQQGWDPADKWGRKWHLCLPLTKPLLDPYYSHNDEPIPLVQLQLTISKRTNTINIKILRPNLIGFDEYFHTRHDAFEAIAGPCHYPSRENEFRRIWTDTVGWTDDANWDKWAAAMAKRTTRWVQEFAPIREAYERLYTDEPATSDIAALPALWQRPNGSLKLIAPLRGIGAVGGAETIAKLTTGTELKLQREPRNTEDHNAVVVHDQAGSRLGYVAREISRLLAPVMDPPSAPTFIAALAKRPEPNPPSAAHRQWDPILRYDEVLLSITCHARRSGGR